MKPTVPPPKKKPDPAEEWRDLHPLAQLAAKAIEDKGGELHINKGALLSLKQKVHSASREDQRAAAGDLAVVISRLIAKDLKGADYAAEEILEVATIAAFEVSRGQDGLEKSRQNQAAKLVSSPPRRLGEPPMIESKPGVEMPPINRIRV